MDPDNSTATARGKGAGEVEEGKGGINGDKHTCGMQIIKKKITDLKLLNS